MYVPHHYRMEDSAEILDFMQKFSFATIITVQNKLPIATHLPFLVEKIGTDIYLSAHFAKANPQWESLEQQPVLVIFSEPHAYVSPQWYDKPLNVPTWNYLAVHAYGEAQLITEAEALTQLLESTIHFYESAYKIQWDTLPLAYKEGLIKGIVGFRLKVTDLQAKKKLSQNKTLHEQNTIAEALSQSEDSSAQKLAEYMRKDKN